jgi:hypothetical protein
MMAPRDPAPVTPLPIESRARLRLRSLGWALLAASLAAAAALPLVLLDPAFAAGGPIALLDPLLRSAGCGFFYGLLAFHLQRVDPDDGHLQAGLVGAVCGIRSLGAGSSAALPPGANLNGVAPSLMMELARAWLPLWLPLVGSALLLHGIRRLTPSLLPTLRP